MPPRSPERGTCSTLQATSPSKRQNRRFCQASQRARLADSTRPGSQLSERVTYMAALAGGPRQRRSHQRSASAEVLASAPLGRLPLNLYYEPNRERWHINS